ncbi:MAG: zinc ABC transporter substrate-binding protein, partial [Tolypothrix sp. Co-bin9]|nr:zinc ABC transporter substrate-binding protein [Tolypothrix sp. Co-bin9]
MKTYGLGSAVLVLALGMTSCGVPQQTTNSASDTTATSPSLGNSEKPKVVATSSVLCDLTQEIAQDTIELTCLIPAGTDPHVYESKPSDRKAIEQAQLILYNGYGFEPGLIKIIESTKNSASKVAVSEVAVPKPLAGEENDHEGEQKAEASHDHEHEGEGEEKAEAGHDHGETDPHVWNNAQNGIQIAETISDNLEKLSPSNAAQYTSNTEKMTSELAQLDSWIKSQITTIPANQRTLVTTHDAMGYYSAAYGIPVEGALQGISTDERATAGRVKELVGEIKSTNVPTIFAETTVNPK